MMSSKMLYSEDNFVVLEPGEAEALLTAEEMVAKLTHWIEAYPDCLPSDVEQEETLEQKIQLLLDESCALELEPGKAVQWFAIRLEK